MSRATWIGLSAVFAAGFAITATQPWTRTSVVEAAMLQQVPPAQQAPPPVLKTGGGSYGGPGDTVPPGGPTGGGGGTCSNPGLLGCTWPCFSGCTNTYVTPHDFGCAPSCNCDPPGGPFQGHSTNGFDITFGDLVGFLGDAACSPASGQGNVTMCLGPFDDVCEIDAFTSQWLWAGTQNNPIPGSVPVQICVKGPCDSDFAPLGEPNAGPLLNGYNHKWSKCLACPGEGCGPAEVRVTFNKRCMQNALTAFIQMWIATIPGWTYLYPGTYDHWMIHIGVVHCEGC
jgi:hypothetical protein